LAEERSGVRRIELTHDILTGVARRSRDKRRELKALEKAERERLEAEKKAAFNVAWCVGRASSPWHSLSGLRSVWRRSFGR
jgi:hypothetical protein